MRRRSAKSGSWSTMTLGGSEAQRQRLLDNTDTRQVWWSREDIGRKRVPGSVVGRGDWRGNSLVLSRSARVTRCGEVCVRTMVSVSDVEYARRAVRCAAEWNIFLCVQSLSLRWAVCGRFVLWYNCPRRALDTFWLYA
jgi:hypothetical protein